MTTREQSLRELPRPQVAYGIYNYGILVGLATTRRAAVSEVEERTGDDWKHAKRYMEIHRVLVSKEPGQ